MGVSLEWASTRSRSPYFGKLQKAFLVTPRVFAHAAHDVVRLY